MQEPLRIFDILNELPELYPVEKDVFTVFRDERLIRVDRNTYRKNAEKVGCYLISAGLKHGDRVASVVSNSPEWNFIDMGVMLAGAVHVPVYPTLSIGDLRYIFNDASVRFLFIEGEQAWINLLPTIKQIETIERIMSVEPVQGLTHIAQITEMEFSDNNVAHLYESARAVKENELATLIYTSGTTGRPKGVMLSHKNILSNVKEVVNIFLQEPVTNVLSVLPLCHVYERVLNYTYQMTGTSVHYVPSLDKFMDDLVKMRPEMFSAVPRLLEKSFAMILQEGRRMSGLRKSVFFWAVELGQKFEPWERRSIGNRILHFFADILVFSRIRRAFGGNLKTIVSGSASLHPNIARFFWAAGIKVMEGYGLTETSPVIAVGNFGINGVKIGTVGKVLPGVEVRIADDGEILCKGPNVMLGYYNRPERTVEVIDRDGWLHTGDIGRIDEEGFLQITDRKKEMFKTSGGKYVAPQVLENKLKESPFIEYVMVVGERRNFPAALIVPDFIHLRSWCEVKGISYQSDESIVKVQKIFDRIAAEVERINKSFSRPEQIKAFRLIGDPWSIHSGELSPTLKLQREFISTKYRTLIEDIYSSDESM
jgi:long-chain acyl-CoA synthetase